MSKTHFFFWKTTGDLESSLSLFAERLEAYLWVTKNFAQLVQTTLDVLSSREICTYEVQTTNDLFVEVLIKVQDKVKWEFCFGEIKTTLDKVFGSQGEEIEWYDDTPMTPAQNPELRARDPKLQAIWNATSTG